MFHLGAKIFLKPKQSMLDSGPVIEHGRVFH